MLVLSSFFEPALQGCPSNKSHGDLLNGKTIVGPTKHSLDGQFFVVEGMLFWGLLNGTGSMAIWVARLF